VIPAINVWFSGIVLLAAACLLLVMHGWYRQRMRRLRARFTRLVASSRRQLHLRLSQNDSLRAEREAYFLHLQELTAPILVTSPEGLILIANGAAIELFGYENERELKRINIAALYGQSFERGARARVPLDLFCRARNTELKMKRKDGSLIDVLVSVRVLQSIGERVYESVWTDITELRRAVALTRELESQLHLAQKLEAVGQLASGIAHEINTPVQFISDNVHYLRGAFGKLATLIGQQQRSLAQQSAAADAPTAPGTSPAPAASAAPRLDLPKLLRDADSAFEESLDGIQRVTEIVRAMKEFAHPGDGELSDVDVNHALATTLIVSRNEYKSVATVETQYGELPLIRGRRGEINKVLLNMIVNASHAIESKVKSTGGRGQITIRTLVRAPHVLIEIADTGCGIPASVIKRIFDPFFTTKAVGKGTGQGLAISRTIVTSHGGHIQVASTPGEGTTFSIFLPMQAEESSIDHDPQTTPEPMPSMATGAG